jgi:hypothetical protein
MRACASALVSEKVIHRPVCNVVNSKLNAKYIMHIYIHHMNLIEIVDDNRNGDSLAHMWYTLGTC